MFTSRPQKSSPIVCSFCNQTGKTKSSVSRVVRFRSSGWKLREFQPLTNYRIPGRLLRGDVYERIWEGNIWKLDATREYLEIWRCSIIFNSKFSKYLKRILKYWNFEIFEFGCIRNYWTFYYIQMLKVWMLVQRYCTWQFVIIWDLTILFIQFSINQLVCESFHHGTGILIIITEYCYTVLVNDETGVQILTVMRTVYTRQITRVMMLVATRVSYFKFELIHVHAGWLDVQRYATWIFKICISYARAYLNKLSQFAQISQFYFYIRAF